MYDFAVVALLALAIVKLVDVVADTVGSRATSRWRSLLTIAAGVAGAVALDYSLFEGFGVAIRDRDLGVWATGLVVAGLTVPWRALFGWLNHDRATVDETLGDRTRVRAA